MAPSHRQKKGLLVGKTKRSKGTKIMAIAAGHSLPVAVCVICIASASPHGVTLVKELLKDRCMGRRPKRLIGDKAYDSHALDELLWAWLHNAAASSCPGTGPRASSWVSSTSAAFSFCLGGYETASSGSADLRSLMF